MDKDITLVNVGYRTVYMREKVCERHRWCEWDTKWRCCADRDDALPARSAFVLVKCAFSVPGVVLESVVTLGLNVCEGPLNPGVP